ncbi:MAG TPA: hypothetical protein VMB50_22345 [Myxococcales bacterium]|nr:hypothetical protein [Myxococcales bacterium]
MSDAIHVVLAAAFALAACSGTAAPPPARRSFRCERAAGCTVTIDGRPTPFAPGGAVPVACAPGVVVVAGCDCGPLPTGVVVSCGCSATPPPSCGCGANLAQPSSCGSCDDSSCSCGSDCCG